eukprot:TRINITY_DN88757_c0_g1_i1.p1 TRINITY_DN88757_c0_g1~~TRINITY_DN88757_c0_g1_i1.p1  ORF type:complete len:201 (+),score=42.79 TRINITY_DN88757_c0_g1_i1:744-1346(+)
MQAFAVANTEQRTRIAATGALRNAYFKALAVVQKTNCKALAAEDEVENARMIKDLKPLLASTADHFYIGADSDDEDVEIQNGPTRTIRAEGSHGMTPPWKENRAKHQVYTGVMHASKEGRYGFIRQSDGSHMFVLPASCPAFGNATPSVGTKVQYSICTYPKTGRLRAESVTAADAVRDRLLQPATPAETDFTARNRLPE